MPGQIPEAVKKQNNLEEHESAIQKATDEYLATWDQPSPGLRPNHACKQVWGPEIDDFCTNSRSSLKTGLF